MVFAPRQRRLRIRQTFSGVIGISRSLVSYPRRASTTALKTAGGVPMQPASPAPFTPRGLLGLGVTVSPVTIAGTSTAVVTK